MKETLENILQKQAFQFTFVHRLCYEFFTYADDTDRQVSLFNDVRT